MTLSLMNMVELAVAAAALAAAIAIERWWRHCLRLATYDRPAFTWHAWFPALVRSVVIALVTLALALVAAWKPLAAVALAVVLAVALAADRWRSSERARLRRLRGQWNAFVRSHADEDPVDVRCAFVLHRHPEWGRELAAQLASDCADPDDLARWIAKIEARAIVRR